MSVYLYRLEKQRGKVEADKHLVASYGQAEEFEKALPGLVGPLHDLIKFERTDTGNGADDFYSLITVVRRLADRTIASDSYKVVGL